MHCVGRVVIVGLLCVEEGKEEEEERIGVHRNWMRGGGV
jgi:hypothetical protein